VVNSKKVSCRIDLCNWKIPKQKTETIYQIGKFDFNVALSTKDQLETFNLDEEFWTIKLLSKVSIKRPQRNIAQKNIQQIIEEPDDRILIKFNPVREKYSSSRFSENMELPRTSYSMHSRSSNYDYLKDNQAEDTQKIYYKTPIVELIDEATSSAGSPTYSTMQPPSFSSINAISRPFEINKDNLW